MQLWNVRFGLATAALLGLAACSGDENPKLMDVRNTRGTPDEFAVLPVKPLQMPASVRELPAPTPGAENITDPTPGADLIAALGGKPGAGAADNGLVARADRYGRDANIRTTLAGEDLKFRQDNNRRLLQRMFNITTYFQAYRPMSLDQDQELARWRASGVRTVGAPPDPRQATR